MSVWSIIPLANGEPYLEGAYPYLKVAVDWAQTLGLKVRFCISHHRQRADERS